MAHRRRLKIFFDGGCRPNPGPMETAVVGGGITYHRTSCGYGTSADAEWMALIHAIEIAALAKARDVVLLGDSAFVIAIANGTTRRRHPQLLETFERLAAIRSNLDRLQIKHIGRHQNLAGIALDRARWD